jgi:hypothetical protein
MGRDRSPEVAGRRWRRRCRAKGYWCRLCLRGERRREIGVQIFGRPCDAQRVDHRPAVLTRAPDAAGTLGDDGTTRSAFAVPAGASSSGAPIPGNNRADRDLTTIDTPQNLNIYGVYDLPVGKGHWGRESFLMRSILGGWSVSGIFTYFAGTPLLITASGCDAPSQGTCMPDLIPGMENKIRMNGSWARVFMATTWLRSSI